MEKEAISTPIEYKIDVLSALKEAGYNTNRLRKDKLIGEAMIQKIRTNQLPSWGTLDTICELLKCDVGDIVKHIPKEEMMEQDKPCHSDRKW